MDIICYETPCALKRFLPTTLIQTLMTVDCNIIVSAPLRKQGWPPTACRYSVMFATPVLLNSFEYYEVAELFVIGLSISFSVMIVS